MLAEALEVDAYIARFADEHDRRQVVRDGHRESRKVLTSAGAVEVWAPRVKDERVDPETGDRRRFCSLILPLWLRKTPKITEVLTLLYLHGLARTDCGGEQPRAGGCSPHSVWPVAGRLHAIKRPREVFR